MKNRNFLNKNTILELMILFPPFINYFYRLGRLQQFFTLKEQKTIFISNKSFIVHFWYMLFEVITLFPQFPHFPI